MEPEDAWREAGLYDPLDPASDDRLELLRYLTERGATTEQMVEAHRMGVLPAVAGELVTQGRTGRVSVADLASSDAWDIAFDATSVMLNGGDAGPGGVTGYCICQNAGATDDALTHMTPASELADFAGVTSAQAPSDPSAWQHDSVSTVIDGWWAYDATSHVVSAVPGKVWALRTWAGAPFVKFHVTSLTGSTQTSAGTVHVEFAVQPAIGAGMGAPQTAEIVAPSDGSPVYFDFASNSSSTDSSAHAWDIAIQGYTIRVNGGVSGPGQAGAVPMDAAFDDITSVDDVPEVAYKADAFGGVFAASKWYRYNLEGHHQIWPTYDVYLIKRGEVVYKVQITGYYSATGAARHITFRYAPLAS